MSSPAESFARRIVQRLQSAGHTAYFAGGCVRDQLMGRPPKDYDVATSATPDQVLALFPRGQQVGAAFGVILLVEKSNGTRLQVEVATFRTDGTYSDGRHPDAVHFTTAEIDAQRRDFTCNGLFLDPLANNGTGQLHDFVGGQADIQAKILRAIGDPEARFREDHLRMLRAVRFAARLGFTIEPLTHAAIVKNAANIRSVSRERIHDELALILTHRSRARAADLLYKSALLKTIWPPELFSDTTAPRRWLALEQIPAESDFVMALISLLSDCLLPSDDAAWNRDLTGSYVGHLLRQALLLSNSEFEDLIWLLDKGGSLFFWHKWTKAQYKRTLADPRWPRLETLFTAHHLSPAESVEFFARLAELRSEGIAPAPFITGDTLIQLGASPGPNFKRWLDTLYNRQLELELTTPAQALAAAQQLIASTAPPSP